MFVCNICRACVCVCECSTSAAKRQAHGHMSSGYYLLGWVPYVTHSGIRECSNTLAIDLFISFL